MEVNRDDRQRKFDIIHKQILKCWGTRESFGKRDPRCTRDNGVHIWIETVYGDIYQFMFIPKYYQGRNLYVWNYQKWSKDYDTITDKIATKKLTLEEKLLKAIGVNINK